MAGKAEDIFHRVYNAVNARRGKQGGGTLQMAELAEILAEEGVDKKKDWGPALLRAKRMTPNLHELFYKAFGREPPNRPTGPRQVEEEAPAEEAEDGAVSMIDCFTTVAHWVGRVTPDERRRILAAVQVLYPEEA